MRRALLLAFLTLGCAHAHLPLLPSAPKEGEPPDLSAMVEFVGRFGVSHGCPLGPWVIYTAAHVTDERPFDPAVPLYPQHMSDSEGREDLAVPVAVDRASDVALMRPTHGPLSRWFPSATEAPKPGEKLWTLGYRKDSREHAFEPRVVRATVARVIAGHVVLTYGGRPGSSGACWVNSRGEAVAIGIWDLYIDVTGEPAGMAAGLWPPWRFKDKEEPKAE
jgi:hypothetical protein